MNRKLTTAIAAAAATASIGTAALAGSGQAHASAPTTALGWSAVVQTWEPDTKPGVGHTLRLVPPTGGSTYLGMVGADEEIVDISLDKSRIITRNYVFDARRGGVARTDFRIWNTATKTSQVRQLPGEWNASFTTGTNILTWRYADGLAYKRNADGVATSRFYGIPGQASVFVNPAGTRYVVGKGKTVNVRSVATGAVQRTINAPTGANTTGCRALTELDANRFALVCEVTADALGDAPTRVYAVGYTASTATKALTTTNGAVSIAATSPMLALASAGDTAWLARVTSTGALTTFPTKSHTHAWSVDGYGSTAFAHVPLGPGYSDGSLRKYNAATGAYTTLTGGPRGGYVQQAMTIDGHR